MLEIPGFSKYTISADGIVYDKDSGEVEQRKYGRYPYVYIYKDEREKKVQVGVHVLLALAAHGPCPEGFVASFVDGNFDNLHLDNIVWVERSKLAARSVTKRMPKKNNSNTPESRRLLYETMLELGAPATMTELSDILQLPYTVIRYTMYHLLADGNAKAVQGGYVAI